MLNGRLNVGTAPFLTTHNALIGQSAASIEDLLATYSEGQIRRIRATPSDASGSSPRPS